MRHLRARVVEEVVVAALARTHSIVEVWRRVVQQGVIAA